MTTQEIETLLDEPDYMKRTLAYCRLSAADRRIYDQARNLRLYGARIR